MPYKSQKQAAFMHIHHPEIAKRWDLEMDKKGEHVPKKDVRLRKPRAK